MSSVVISGDSSGQITLAAPAVAGSTTLTLPATTGNVVADTATQTLTNKTLTGAVLNSSTLNGGSITSGTAVASTSGTSINFTSIPSWAKRITVMFSGVSVSGTSNFLIQIGSGAVETSGYTSGSMQTYTATGAQVGYFSSTAGYVIGNNVAANLVHGNMVLTLVTSNTWVASSAMVATTGTPLGLTSAGTKSASGAIDRVRITTVNGTDTFDAGTINIMWEG